MNTVIETARTNLRPFCEDDLTVLCALHLDPAVMRFIGGGVRRTTDEVTRDLARYIEHQKTHGYSRWAVIHRTDNAFVGHAGFLYLPDTKEIDLGYILRREYWGMGIASEIAVALCDMGARKPADLRRDRRGHSGKPRVHQSPEENRNGICFEHEVFWPGRSALSI